jgi:hypothetical protein
MKRKVITLGITTLVSSIILGNSSYSQSIELFTKDNEKYMPVKLFVKKLGGEYKEMEDGYIFNVNGKDIAVKEYASFAKIDDHYEPLKVTKVDGWNVPTDVESIYQENEVYIPAMFLQSFQVADYSISGDDLVVEKEKVVVKAPVIVKKSKDSKPKPTPVYNPKPPVNIEEPKEDDNKPEPNTNEDNNPKPPVNIENPKEDDNKPDSNNNNNPDPDQNNNTDDNPNPEPNNNEDNTQDPQQPPQKSDKPGTIIPETTQ